MISHKNLIEEFLKFEDDHNLLDWSIKSVPIWEIIRTKVFTELSTKKVNTRVIKLEKEKKKRFNLFFKILKNSLIYNPFFKRERSDLLFLNHPRRKFNKNIYEDIYVDNYLIDLNNYVVLEGFVNVNKDHFRPVKTNNLYYLDFFQILGSLSSMFIYNIRISEKDKLKIKDVKLELKNKWGLELNGLDNEILNSLKRWKVTTFWFNLLLKKNKPKLIINVVSYSFMNQVFSFVAKKHKIPTAELQHGTVGRYHVNYNFKKADKVRLLTGPDYFLGWSNYWMNSSRLPVKKENQKAVGFPYIDSFREGNKTAYKNTKKTIVFISQIREDLAFFLQNVAEMMPNYNFLFKAHPAEYDIAESKYSSILTSKNITILTDDKVNLYDIFKSSYCVFGVNSTALIEALAFCPKVGIIKLPRWEYFENLDESYNLKFVNTSEEAIDYLNTPLKSGNIQLTQKYFVNNSKQKVLNFIKNFK